MVASGILGFIAQICLTKSFQMADASLLAPLDFSSVIWSFLIGYIFFQEFITLNVLVWRIDYNDECFLYFLSGKGVKKANCTWCK